MDNFFQTRNNIGKDNRCRSRALEYGGKFMYQIRTDLALETQEKMQEDHVDLKGVRFLEEKVDKNITVSTVVIETENGAKTMGKPKGTYITIEAGNMDEEDEDYHREISVREFDTLKCKKVPQSLETGLFFCQIFIFII